MIEDNFDKYEQLKRNGASGEAACMAAMSDGKDFTFQIRMLRSVFGMDLASARDVAAAISLKS